MAKEQAKMCRLFIGNSLTLKTAFNCHTIALDVKEPDNHQYDVFYSWNDLEKIDWSQIDIIIHFAGKGCILRFSMLPAKVLLMNLLTL